MNRISKVFGRGHKALIAYLTVGYPSVEATLKAVPLLSESGCDMVELGIPFSDPMADGATIQRASFTALENGVTPALCLDVAKEIRQKMDLPLLFMTYYNIILKYGLEEFCRESNKSGIDALIIPDLPPEESLELQGLARNNGVDLIYFLAPTSTDRRLRLVCERASGFIYLVSVSGVTGPREELPQGLLPLIRKIKGLTHKPVCVGFGISNPTQAAAIARSADGVIIGSRLLEILASDGYEGLRKFTKELKVALDGI